MPFQVQRSDLVVEPSAVTIWSPRPSEGRGLGVVVDHTIRLMESPLSSFQMDWDQDPSEEPWLLEESIKCLLKFPPLRVSA